MKIKNEEFSKYPEDINYILDNFDFERVKKVVDCLDWHWVSCEDTPSTYELRTCARKLLEEVMYKGQKQEEDIEISKGGFIVSYFYNDNFLSLSFIVEDYDNSILLLERDDK